MPGVGAGVVQGILAALGDGANVLVAATSGLQLVNAADAQSPTQYNTSSGFYTEYELQTYYQDKENILQLANATPAGGSPNASIVQWANPTMALVVDFVARKVGDWPDVPAKQAQDTNLVYQGGEVWPEPPDIRGDGFSLEYTIRGRYRYAVINPNAIVYRTGFYPWMNTDAAADSTMPTSVFSNAVMNPSGGAGAGAQAGASFESVPTVVGNFGNIK